MLVRIGADRFAAPVGQQTQIVSRSRNNNGVNDARYEYNGTVLQRQTIQGLPGCTFTVVAATQTFEAVVAFDPATAATARYDLFEVDPGGGLLDLQEDAFPADPVINFGITGEPAAAAAVRAGVTRAGAARAGRARENRAPARKRAAARKRQKAAPRKGTARRSAAKKRKAAKPRSASASARRRTGAKGSQRRGTGRRSR